MAQAARLGRLLYVSYSSTNPLRTGPFRLCTPPQLSGRSIATHTYAHHASAISVLPTNVDVSSSQYKQNAQEMGEVMARMNELHAKIEGGGPQKARDKHVARGKMLPREYVATSVTRRTEHIAELKQPGYSSHRSRLVVPRALPTRRI